MDQTKSQHHGAYWNIEAQVSATAKVVEGLIDHRETNQCIHKIGVGADVQPHAQDQCEAVADGEKSDVERNVSEPVNKKDDAGEE